MTNLRALLCFTLAITALSPGAIHAQLIRTPVTPTPITTTPIIKTPITTTPITPPTKTATRTTKFALDSGFDSLQGVRTTEATAFFKDATTRVSSQLSLSAISSATTRSILTAATSGAQLGIGDEFIRGTGLNGSSVAGEREFISLSWDKDVDNVTLQIQNLNYSDSSFSAATISKGTAALRGVDVLATLYASNHDTSESTWLNATNSTIGTGTLDGVRSINIGQVKAGEQIFIGNMYDDMAGTIAQRGIQLDAITFGVVSAVPEPSAAWLLSIGLGLIVNRRRKI